MKRWMRFLLSLTLAAATILLVSSCATMVTTADHVVPLLSRKTGVINEPLSRSIRHAKQIVPVLSHPEGATVKVYTSKGDFLASHTTPVRLPLDKDFGYFQKPGYRLVIEKPGYHERVFIVDGRPNISWYLLGNFVLGGPIGWLLADPYTGAMWALTPSEINAVLKPTGPVAAGEEHVTAPVPAKRPERPARKPEPAKVPPPEPAPAAGPIEEPPATSAPPADASAPAATNDTSAAPTDAGTTNVAYYTLH